MNKELLKEVLSIPSYSGRELKLVNYICEFLKKNNIPYEVDKMSNIYCTKGETDTYPCVVAHTDTVHNNTYIDVRTELKENSKCIHFTSLERIIIQTAKELDIDFPID